MAVQTLTLIQPVTLLDLMSTISQAAHGLTDTAGRRMALPTIGEETLRSAALLAVQIASGTVVWPADAKLVVKRPVTENPLVEYER